MSGLCTLDAFYYLFICIFFFCAADSKLSPCQQTHQTISTVVRNRRHIRLPKRQQNQQHWPTNSLSLSLSTKQQTRGKSVCTNCPTDIPEPALLLIQFFCEEGGGTKSMMRTSSLSLEDESSSPAFPACPVKMCRKFVFLCLCYELVLQPV